MGVFTNSFGSSLGTGGSKVNPFPVPSLQSLTTQFEVIQVGSDYYFKALKGANILITNCDLVVGSKGWPYKSVCTIDAFGQTGLNAIFLFQNFDYLNQYFAKHEAQTVDGNGVEVTPAYVSSLCEYSAPLTGADLASAISFFNSPVELVSAMRYVDPAAANDTGTGLKASPWKTLTKAETSATLGDTVYRKSGILAEAAFFYARTNKTWSAIGKAIIRSAGTTYAMGNDTSVVHITGFTFDGQTTAGTVAAIYVASILSKCKYINPKAASNLLYLNADGLELKDSIFPHYSGYGKIEFRVNCIISGSYLASQMLSAMAGKIFQFINNRIIVDYSGLNWFYLQVNSGIVIKGGTIDITAIESFIYTQSGTDLTSTLSITDVNININACSFALLRLGDKSFANVDLKRGRTINYSSAPIISSSAGSNITIEDEYIEQKTAISGIVINKVGAKTNTVTIKNSTINIPLTTSGYGACIGNESTSSGDNTMTFDVSKSKFLGINYYNPGSINVPHGVFIGFQNTGSAKHTYVNGLAYGFGIKGDNTDCSNVVVEYNVYRNGLMCGIGFEGCRNGKSYNNLLINNTIEFKFFKNPIGTIGSTGQTVKNHIAINEGGLLYSLDADSLTGHDFDYNIYYSDQAKPFSVAGVVKTFAEWQALGYDAHSVMLPTLAAAKALFTNYDAGDYSLIAGSAAIGVGTALDAAYDDGLDSTTVWGTDSQLPVIVTKQQAASWDIGAYIH